MANNQIQTYADMVNLQVASEAFLTQTRLDSAIDAVLKRGNKNITLEPDSIAALFVTGGSTSGTQFKMSAECRSRKVCRKSGASMDDFFAVLMQHLPVWYPPQIQIVYGTLKTKGIQKICGHIPCEKVETPLQK